MPTVTGRLSFSHFGSCDAYNTRDVNRADPAKRYLLVYQTRNTSDILLPFRRHLGELLFSLRGEMQFVCIAETKDLPPDKQTLLAGRMFILDHGEKWRDFVRQPIRQARDKLQAYNFTADAPSIEAYFHPSADEVTRICSENCYFQGRFSLHRNGVVDIVVDSEAERSKNAPRLPDEPTHQRHVRHILAAQLFFFLKDIGHRHQHHNARTDTIVDLYDVGTEGNDLNWRLSTLYSIYRRIISNRRMLSVNAHFSSLGLLAYAKSFRRVCIEQLPSWLHGRLPIFYDEALEESVRASELDMAHRTRLRHEKSEARRNANIFVFGFLFSILGLLSLTNTRLSVSPDRWLIYIAEAFVAKPLVSITLVMVFVYLTGINYAGYFQPEHRQISRTAFYLLQPFNRVVTSAIFIIIGITLIVTPFLLTYRSIGFGIHLLD